MVNGRVHIRQERQRLRRVPITNPNQTPFRKIFTRRAYSLETRNLAVILRLTNRLLEFKNGDMVNKSGENEGSAKVLSYAALSNLDKETTLKLWGQYYREVLDDPEGDSHQNIRNFMKYGWEGVPFENGIALTRKNVGENEWDRDAESWIP